MISRYASPEMSALWSEEAKFARWRDVEVAVVAAQAEAGLVPRAVLDAVRAAPVPTVERVEHLEREVRHDVVAFMLAFTEGMDTTAASFVHRDLTSSDLVDTAQASALRVAADRISSAGRQFVAALGARALQHRRTVCVARTHGQAAAVDVFGHRLADLAFAADRVSQRLDRISSEICTLNLTGPVGVGIGLSPRVRRSVGAMLGLQVPEVTTQVVFRDALASWVAELAVLGGVCEALATDIRLGNHDGVAEVSEGFRPQQVGSSSMPHKQNPISAEKVCGIARLLRGYVSPVLEDIALWQHRDLTHSSVERVLLPDVTALAEHMLVTATELCANLVVHETTMLDNVTRAGRGLASSRVLSRLLISGVPRAEAMAAARAWANGVDAADHKYKTEARSGSRGLVVGDDDAPRSDSLAGSKGEPMDREVAVAVEELLASETLELVFDDLEALLARLPHEAA